MAISYRGKPVDMVSLAKKYEKSIALGNAHMNGRGDILEHGKVVKTREEQLADWYANHTTIKSTQNLKENMDTDTQEVQEDKVSKGKKVRPKYEDITEEEINELKRLNND